MKITPDVKETLQNMVHSIVHDRERGKFIIPPQPQIDNSDYAILDKIIKNLRGKWKRNVGHVFSYNPKRALELVIESGEVPPKNPLEFYPTPERVINWMLQGLCEYAKPFKLTIMEPSAGDGVIVEKLLEKYINATIVAIEPDPVNFEILENKFGDNERVELFFARFEDLTPQMLEERGLQSDIDLIVMNPPFRLYREHIELAAEWTKASTESTHVISIVPASVTHPNMKRKRDREFDQRIMSKAGVQPLPDNSSFIESGTNVNTVIVEYYGDVDPMFVMDILIIELENELSTYNLLNELVKDIHNMDKNLLGEVSSEDQETIYQNVIALRNSLYRHTSIQYNGIGTYHGLPPKDDVVSYMLEYAASIKE